MQKEEQEDGFGWGGEGGFVERKQYMQKYQDLKQPDIIGKYSEVCLALSGISVEGRREGRLGC